MKMQVTQATITKNCREIHGQSAALDIAFDELRTKYENVMEAECNIDATIQVVMHIERED